VAADGSIVAVIIVALDRPQEVNFDMRVTYANVNSISTKLFRHNGYSQSIVALVVLIFGVVLFIRLDELIGRKSNLIDCRRISLLQEITGF